MKASVHQIRGWALANPNTGPHNDSQGFWQRGHRCCKIVHRNRDWVENDQCLNMGFLPGLYMSLCVCRPCDQRAHGTVASNRVRQASFISQSLRTVTMCSSVGRAVIPHWCQAGYGELLLDFKTTQTNTFLTNCTAGHSKWQTACPFYHGDKHMLCGSHILEGCLNISQYQDLFECN